MNIEKATQDLNDLLLQIEDERKQFEKDKFKPFAELFHSYDNSFDPNECNLSINIDERMNYSKRNIRSFTISRENSIAYRPHLSPTICTFTIDVDKRQIMGLDINGNLNFDFEDVHEHELVKYNLFRLKFITVLATIFRNESNISEKLLAISNNDNSELYRVKSNAVEFMKRMLQNYTKIEISDYILKNGGIKFNDALDSYQSVLVSSFSPNESKYIDTIFFTQNPSGTYTIKLYNRGNMVDESSRASEDKLNHYITVIVDYLVSFKENLKDFYKN
jgi:hypothetical protein